VYMITFVVLLYCAAIVTLRSAETTCRGS